MCRQYLKRWHWTICKQSFNCEEVCSESEIWMYLQKGSMAWGGGGEGREEAGLRGAPHNHQP